jgi:hypothetical protein
MVAALVVSALFSAAATAAAALLVWGKGMPVVTARWFGATTALL